MSELMSTQSTERSFRWRLLTTVSALALLASVNIRDAKADEDADHPTIWIELGGQLEHVEGQGQPFIPGFLSVYPDSNVLQTTTPVQAQNPAPFSFGGNGKISFQPEKSDWVFSAAVNYGRSSNNKHVDHQTNGFHHAKYQSGLPETSGPYLTQENFANTKVHHQESHTVLDFSVGKDVGLGMFGKDASSTFNLGVRFAQFTSKETFDVRARPDLQFKYFPSAGAPTRDLFPYFHTYHATGQASRSFHGIGPSLSWNGSTPFVGNSQSGEITFDWGANAAILFGRQKAHVRHQETAHYVSPQAIFNCSQYNLSKPCYAVVYRNPPRGDDTDRFVTVPNIGGFAGISIRRGAAKVSLGYRADFFFGAMDVGIDKRKAATLGFYGPFASVSIGLGG